MFAITSGSVMVKERPTLLVLTLGLTLATMDILRVAKTLKANILWRLLLIAVGVSAVWSIDPRFLRISREAVLIGLAVGLSLMTIHIILARGVRLKRADINKGLILTSLLIYGLELPAEESLYRGMVLIPMLMLLHPVLAIVLSAIVFVALHVSTWTNKFVWIGSFILALACAWCVYATGSIWSAVVIHTCNNLAYMTLVNRRNIFG